MLECHSARTASSASPSKANASCNALFPMLGQIPTEQDLVMTRPDDHGEPPLLAPHGVCAASPQGTADAYDWNFCWKVWDALRDCAYYGTTAATRSATRVAIAPTASGATASPIKPLKIQDTAPIRP